MFSKLKLRRHNGVWWNSDNMDEHYTYNVVQFIQQPYPEISKYVCVPSSWIKTRRETDNKVGVLYPEGDKAAIDKLVEKNQKIKSSTKAHEYLCELLFSTNEYNSAKIFIMMKSTKDVTKARFNAIKNKDSKVTVNATLSEKQSQPAENEIPPNNNNNLKRRHSACNRKSVESNPTPVKRPIYSKSIEFFWEIGASVITLGEKIQSFAESLEESTLLSDDREASQIQDNEIVDSSSDAANIRKKRTSQFELPPEYDQNNSRWTLKYQEPGDYLIELMPDSRVYVKSYELGLCLKNAQNDIQLTKAMLGIVFSDNALKTCSITGCKPFAYETDDIRPGLDKEAKDAMLNFIQLYGANQGWEQSTERALNVAIRNKLSDVRKKVPRKSKNI